MAFDGFPFVIGWELTLGCNLRCRHCGSAAGAARENELTTREALAICDQFPALLVQEVDFTGGEPLMRNDWSIIVSHLRELNIPSKIITNGIMLEPGVISKMEGCGIAGVGISIDGLETIHESIRGVGGLFKKIIAGIQRLQEANIPITVLTTANALNIDQLPALFDKLSSLGIKEWQIQPIFPFGRAEQSSGLQLSKDQYMQLGLFIQAYWPRANESGILLEPADSFGYFTELDPRQPAWRGCAAGLLTCGITSDGKIKGCLSMPDELAFGNLREASLWDLWFDAQSFPYTRLFSVQQLGPNCKFCEMGEQCRGGCSSMSYGNTGAFHNDPYCFTSLSPLYASSPKKMCFGGIIQASAG